jgi:hypothetical protein
MFDLSVASAFVVVAGFMPLLRLWSTKLLATHDSGLVYDFGRVVKVLAG